jgi:hypothetical protein
MVYEHFSKCFIPKDPYSWFSKLFKVTIVVTCGDIPRLVALMLGVQVSRLMAMAKDTSGLHPIAMGKMSFLLINHSIILQLRGSFQEQLSPPDWSSDPWKL